MIRQVKREDSKRIWEIRNYPVSRQYSNNPEEIPFEQHDVWFQKKYFSGMENYCFVLDNEKCLVIGYCRLDFDDENGYYIISIAIDCNCHGNGLGHFLLSETLSQPIGQKEIFAEIQKGNDPSIKLFQKNNFKIFKEDKKNYYLRYLQQNNGFTK